MSKYKTSGTVILYNPDESVIDNINSYINSLDVLYVIDNSEIIKQGIVKEIKKIKAVQYISNKNNMGIANALNISAEKAIKNGSDFLFTIDQDSCASGNMIETMFNDVKDIDINSIGIISPVQIYTDKKVKTKDKKIEKVLEVMTSGNLLNLQAYKKTGPFLDSLFIDYVDVEYCLRLNINSFSVLKVNSAALFHKLGATKIHNLFFFSFPTTNHPPLRRYYMARNRLYVYSRYKKYYPEYCKSIIKAEILDILKIIFSEKEKFQKILMTTRGILDFINNKFGQYKLNSI